MRIYEINTRAHCKRFDDITDSELVQISSFGFDALWLMGVWQISEGARGISKIVSEDHEGSPFAVPDYIINPSLGGERGFRALVERAHAARLLVVVDFVSNHMALDSPWISEDRDLFIRSNPRVRSQSIRDYFLHASGELIAFGRDPYFEPWYDTAQLDYTNPKLRTRMTNVLKYISGLADGVRCDMAMLLMRDYIRRQWYPDASDKWFDERMAGEFWREAISEVKAAKPSFSFIAEAYWDKEPELLELGFDLAYEKKLYDGLVARDIVRVVERLVRDSRSLGSSLNFTENHDEPRAAALFGRGYNLATAALILSLPGSVLIHEGQMEGNREKLLVHRLKPLVEEPIDHSLRAAYQELLRVTSEAVFRSGSFTLYDSGVPGVLSFVRQHSNRTVVYAGRISEQSPKFNSMPLNITGVCRMLGSPRQLSATNLIAPNSIRVTNEDGGLQLDLTSLGVDDEAEFALIEVAAD